MAQNSFQEKVKELKRAINGLPPVAHDLGVQFFKSRFRAQGWLDKSFQPWKKRKKLT